MVAHGVTYDSLTSDYSCTDGDLVMTMDMSGMAVTTNPKFSFEMEPKCTACSNSGKTPAFPGNTVLDCPDCTMASAQAIRYTVKATNNFPEAPGLHDADNNFINGSETPSMSTSSFRGADETEV